MTSETRLAAAGCLILSAAFLPLASQSVGSGTSHQARSIQELLPDTSQYAGYLFTHMISSDYGRLYYAISKDGRHFTRINGGKRINDEYRGHTCITKGHDGRYYMTGGGSPAITFWVSGDLVKWEKHGETSPDVKGIAIFKNGPGNHGAPKLYYDDVTAQYIVTWQTAMAARDPKYKGIDERYWGSHRAVYCLSKDLRTFSDPKLLLPEHDVAAIDIINTRVGNRYYTIFKDERHPGFDYPMGKSVRVSWSSSLTGPYSTPGPPVSPNFREAPSVVPRLDRKGWYMYFEQYTGVQYEIATAARLEGPWYNIYFHERAIAADTRHGFVFPITQEQWNDIVAAYGEK